MPLGLWPALGVIEREAGRYLRSGFTIDSLSFGCAAKVGRCIGRWLASDADFLKRTVKGFQTSFVQTAVDTVTSMDLLDVGLISVTSAIQRGATKGLGKIRGQPLRVVRVQAVFKGVGRFRVGQAQFMPAMG
jgi:hypothetical protein